MELSDVKVGDRIVAQTKRGAVRGNIRVINPNGTIHVTTSSGVRAVDITEITRMVKRAV